MTSDDGGRVMGIDNWHRRTIEDVGSQQEAIGCCRGIDVAKALSSWPAPTHTEPHDSPMKPVFMRDPHAALRDAVLDRVLTGPGETDSALRQAAAANAGLPADLQSLL